METQSILGTLILFFTGLATYKGFKDSRYRNEYLFHVDKILIGKDYKRLFTSGFLHGSWLHFGFNMIALLSFSISVENLIGWKLFLFLYLASLLGGSLLALYIHRNHGDYTALGASGAISGVIMASILMNPNGGIGFVFIPFSIPSWIFGLLFVVISIFGIKSQSDNIGHDAHLGGALTGTFLLAALEPQIAWQNWWVFLLIVVPTIGFLWIINNRPEVLITQKWNMSMPKLPKKKSTAGRSKNVKGRHRSDQNHIELDRLLDKIKKHGMSSLSKTEKALLEKYREGL